MSLRLLTAGESHGPELVAIVEGLPAGVAVDPEAIDHQLERRRGGHGRGARSTKIERDHAQVVSGVAAGLT
ncbi:MAG: chorismate synthase, partial [Streptosporangiaceae bacterium]